jgi:SAM-dependent methyltransferase
MQKNVTVLLGSQDDTTLPRECCDAILLRLVYHAFRNPNAMRESLARALRPGGRILIIDFPGGPWAGPTATVLEEQMAEVGCTRVDLHDSWQGQQGVFAVLFRKPPLNKNPVDQPGGTRQAAFQLRRPFQLTNPVYALCDAEEFSDLPPGFGKY